MSTLNLKELLNLVKNTNSLNKIADQLKGYSEEELLIQVEDMESLGFVYEAERLRYAIAPQKHVDEEVQQRTAVNLAREIRLIARALTAIAYIGSSRAESPQDLLAGYDLEDLHEIEILSIDLTKVAFGNIYNLNDRRTETGGVHPIITLEYNNTTLSVGANLKSRSLSYRVNKGPLRFFNFELSRTAARPGNLAWFMTNKISEVLVTLLGID